LLVVTPLRVVPRYDEHPVVGTMFTTPPVFATAPACTAAVQRFESSV
jgi:hypothetical protein